MNDIEKAIIFYDGNGDMPYCDLVYKSLKKRLPMKPIKISYKIKELFNFCCPKCKKSIVYKANGDWMMAGKPPKYCGECGQALDWSGDGE